MIRVRLPSTLTTRLGRELIVDDSVGTITDLVDALARRDPGLRAQLADAVFNFAVNDEMLLHRALEHRLKDGDTVEIVPAIAGGAGPSGKGKGEGKGVVALRALSPTRETQPDAEPGFPEA